MIYGLQEKDLARVNTEAVKGMIDGLQKRLKNPYLSRNMIKGINDEIQGLYELLEIVKEGK